jgi:maleylpyruvate isomerase
LKLYSYWRSSSAWRVRIALAYKNVDCEIVPVHLLRDGGEQHRAEFLARNPLAQVPLLEVEGDGADEVVRLTQSMAILEYLEERFPEPPLLPRDLQSRARARQLAQVVVSGIQPLQNLRLQQELGAQGVNPRPFMKRFIELGLGALEQMAGASAGSYLVGDMVTYADVVLVPQLYAARRFDVDIEAFPTLRRVERACEVLAVFATAHPSAQPDRESEAGPPDGRERS